VNSGKAPNVFPFPIKERFDLMSVPIFAAGGNSAPGNFSPCVFVEMRHFVSGIRYCIAHRRGIDLVVYSDTDYTDNFTAHVAAVAFSKSVKARLVCSNEMKRHLVIYYRNQGRQLFHDDQPRSFCVNQFEREGYDAAEAELMAVLDEKETKPGLTNSVTMTVMPGEYGPCGKGKWVTA
jgi:hypothetical protein